MAGRGNPSADLASSSGQDSDYGWSSPDETTRRPFSRDPAEVLDLASQYDLCVVGDALRHLAATGAERLFIPLIQVLAPRLCSGDIQGGHQCSTGTVAAHLGMGAHPLAATGAERLFIPLIQARLLAHARVMFGRGASA